MAAQRMPLRWVGATMVAMSVAVHMHVTAARHESQGVQGQAAGAATARAGAACATAMDCSLGGTRCALPEHR